MTNIERMLSKNSCDRDTFEPRGLGDTVAKITHTEVLGLSLADLAKLYTKLTGKPCGCKQRQEALNKLFPYEDRV